VADRNDRFHDVARGENDGRSEARHDRDRILYSSAFRRLGGVTQVVSPTEHYPIHTRLTHTLEVAQVGRGLAEHLLLAPQAATLAHEAGGLDPDVVEAAALAHDLGHPPFGHVAEQELDELVKNRAHVADGFEGNAQSFRILTRLAVRYRTIDGLNPTRATLGAVLKYPWLRATTGHKAEKWGAYGTEQNLLAWAREACPLGGDNQSIEAFLMDWADDVAYAVHDLEDFFRAGLIPFDRLATDPAERERFVAAETSRLEGKSPFTPDDLRHAFARLIELAPFATPFTGSRLDRAGLRAFTSSLINRYINAVSWSTGGTSSYPISVEDWARMEVTMLKALTWHYVIGSRSLATQRFGQRALIRSLFDVFHGATARPTDWSIFPDFYRNQLLALPDDAARTRLVADLIASMTETQVVDLHHRLTGASLGSALDPVLP
jgi:dGTPase